MLKITNSKSKQNLLTYIIVLLRINSYRSTKIRFRLKENTKVRKKLNNGQKLKANIKNVLKIVLFLMN